MTHSHTAGPRIRRLRHLGPSRTTTPEIALTVRSRADLSAAMSFQEEADALALTICDRGGAELIVADDAVDADPRELNFDGDEAECARLRRWG